MGRFTGGQRRAENVIVGDGKVTLRTKRTSGVWTYAGISNSRAMKRTYGKFEIRARLDSARGTRAVALLWPANNGGWPPEVDFFEVAGDNPARTDNLTANHYREDGVHKIQHALVESDYTKWHRIGVIWNPSSLRFTLDGKVVAVQRGQVPQQDMWLGLRPPSAPQAERRWPPPPPRSTSRSTGCRCTSGASSWRGNAGSVKLPASTPTSRQRAS